MGAQDESCPRDDFNEEQISCGSRRLTFVVVVVVVVVRASRPAELQDKGS